jgi:hypothetical protein
MIPTTKIATADAAVAPQTSPLQSVGRTQGDHQKHKENALEIGKKTQETDAKFEQDYNDEQQMAATVFHDTIRQHKHDDPLHRAKGRKQLT